MVLLVIWSRLTFTWCIFRTLPRSNLHRWETFPNTDTRKSWALSRKYKNLKGKETAGWPTLKKDTLIKKFNHLIIKDGFFPHNPFIWYLKVKKTMLYWSITVRFSGSHWHPMLFQAKILQNLDKVQNFYTTHPTLSQDCIDNHCIDIQCNTIWLLHKVLLFHFSWLSFGPPSTLCADW